MNAHSMPFAKIISSESGAREHSHVPKYQREYAWGKGDWERVVTSRSPRYDKGSSVFS